MLHNFVFGHVSEALPRLLNVLETANEVGSRAGRTRELCHVGITLTEPWRREVILDHRKPSIAAQIAETMWVLAGRDDIGWLGHYLPRAKDFSDDGATWRAGYGKRLRNWPRRDGSGDVIDQFRFVLETLKQSPGSRQAVMSIWDPVIDTNPGKDIPCNDWLSFSSRLGKLDLHVGVRSNDIIWGWSGINTFEWSSMLEIAAGLLGLEVGSLHFSTTSFHIYDHHWNKARSITESATPLRAADSPRFDPSYFDRDFDSFDRLCAVWFETEQLIRQGGDARLAQAAVDAFPEPMLKSWLRVLQWWWSKGDASYLEPLEGTALQQATYYSVQPKRKDPAMRILEGIRRSVEPTGDLQHQALRRQAVDRSTYLISRNETQKVKDALKTVDAVRVVEIPDHRLSEFLRELNRLESPVNTEPFPPSDFIQFAIKTHNEKHAAYGDSWKRRGEMLGIMANIARKVDRLGQGETSDETSADTAMDLMVYLAKYRVWLADGGYAPGVAGGSPWPKSDSPDAANTLLLEVERSEEFEPITLPHAFKNYEEALREDFDELEKLVVNDSHNRHFKVEEMLADAYRLARTLWEQESNEYRGADVD